MGPFRVLPISIVVLMLFGSTWLVRVVGMAASPTGDSTTWLGSQDALAGVLQQGDNGDNNNGDNHGGDNGDNSGGGDNGDNSSGNSNNNGNSNDNSFDDNDNFGLDLPPSSSSSEARRPPEPTCSTPGQDTVFTSHDDKVTVRIFGNSPRPVRIEIYQVIDFLSAPLPPGNLVGLLAYEIRASYCDTNPLMQLPAEANLAIHYNDIEATGLDESRFVIGHLDVPTGTWTPVEKRANDPNQNVTTATIIDTGFYMVWEAR
jgi:hypothetical protein